MNIPKVSDDEIVKLVTEFMAENKLCSVRDITLNINTSYARLERLQKEGRLTLPPKRSMSIIATQNRKKNGYYKGWTI